MVRHILPNNNESATRIFFSRIFSQKFSDHTSTLFLAAGKYATRFASSHEIRATSQLHRGPAGKRMFSIRGEDVKSVHGINTSWKRRVLNPRNPACVRFAKSS
jgi:hypothetical protein